MAKPNPGSEITHVNPALHFWCYGYLQPCAAPLNWVDGHILQLQNGRIVSLGCHSPWRRLLGFITYFLGIRGSIIFRRQQSLNNPKDERWLFLSRDPSFSVKKTAASKQPQRWHINLLRSPPHPPKPTQDSWACSQASLDLAFLFIPFWLVRFWQWVGASCKKQPAIDKRQWETTGCCKTGLGWNEWPTCYWNHFSQMPCAVIFCTFRPKPLAKTQQLESERQIGWGVPRAVKIRLEKSIGIYWCWFASKPRESFSRP